MRIRTSAMAVCASLLLILSVTGCATRRFVRNRVDPVDAHVNKVEAQSAAHNAALDKKIDGVDENSQRGVSHAEEIARSAGADAKTASDQAGKAQSSADDAGRQASSAQGLAERGMTRIAGVETTVDNLDRYQPLSKESLVFAFGSATLSPKAKEQVDQLVQSVSSTKRFVVEVEGFTDSSGSPEYNRALAAKRADAVVRYLTVSQKLPLYRIHSLGVGEEMPVENNKTREGRQQNRRVEIQILAPPDTASSQAKAFPPGENR